MISLWRSKAAWRSFSLPRAIWVFIASFTGPYKVTISRLFVCWISSPTCSCLGRAKPKDFRGASNPWAGCSLPWQKERSSARLCHLPTRVCFALIFLSFISPLFRKQWLKSCLPTDSTSSSEWQQTWSLPLWWKRLTWIKHPQNKVSSIFNLDLWEKPYNCYLSVSSFCFLTKGPSCSFSHCKWQDFLPFK